MKYLTIDGALLISLCLSVIAVQAQNEDPAKPKGPAPIVTPEGGKIPTVQPLSPRNTPSVPPGGPLSNPVGGGSASSSSSSPVLSPLPSRPVPGTPEARAMQQRIEAAGSYPVSNTFDPKTQSYTTEMSNGNIYSTKGFKVEPPEAKPELRRQKGGLLNVPGQGGAGAAPQPAGNIYETVTRPQPQGIYNAPEFMPKGASNGSVPSSASEGSKAQTPASSPSPRTSTSNSAPPPIPPLPREASSPPPPIPSSPRTSTSNSAPPPLPPLPREASSPPPPIPPSPRTIGSNSPKTPPKR